MHPIRRNQSGRFLDWASNWENERIKSQFVMAISQEVFVTGERNAGWLVWNVMRGTMSGERKEGNVERGMWSRNVTREM